MVSNTFTAFRLPFCQYYPRAVSAYTLQSSFWYSTSSDVTGEGEYDQRGRLEVL